MPILLLFFTLLWDRRHRTSSNSDACLCMLLPAHARCTLGCLNGIKWNFSSVPLRIPISYAYPICDSHSTVAYILLYAWACMCTLEFGQQRLEDSLGDKIPHQSLILYQLRYINFNEFY